jgi:hypothetical protein
MKNFKLKYHLFSALAVGFFLLLAFGSSNSNSESSPPDLKATVSFDGTQFVIKNNDNFDYNNAKLEINDKYVLEGYTLKAGQTYTVGMMQFADKDGNRFTMMQKPQRFYIRCKLPSGEYGSYYAGWK